MGVDEELDRAEAALRAARESLVMALRGVAEAGSAVQNARSEIEFDRLQAVVRAYRPDMPDLVGDYVPPQWSKLDSEET